MGSPPHQELSWGFLDALEERRHITTMVWAPLSVLVRVVPGAATLVAGSEIKPVQG